MTTVTADVQPAGPRIAAEPDPFAGRVFDAMLGSIDLLTIYVGERLGLYQVLFERGAATPGELADAAGIHERYAREWLEQQAVAGIVEAGEAWDPGEGVRRFSLPAAHAEALLDRDSLLCVAPLARQMVALASRMPELLNAYRYGGGVAWAVYGPDMYETPADFNRPPFLHLLAGECLPSMPDVVGRLESDPPARVAEIGCGGGWASIAIAKAFPKVLVDGFDFDKPSIVLARRHAFEAGVANRVRFDVRDAAAPGSAGSGDPYDLVVAFECIHDMSRPVQALQTMRRLVADTGSVLVMDERVAESFVAPGDDVERFMYGWSTLVCLPNGLAEEPSAGTGTVMRERVLRTYAAGAGYQDVEALPVQHDFWRFYRLRPLNP
jgi:SAM-dependent methyltransferase